jgi:hypothetical protein
VEVPFLVSVSEGFFAGVFVLDDSFLISVFGAEFIAAVLLVWL